MYRIEGYLTESKLVDFLKYTFHESKFVGTQVRISNLHRYRWDAVVKIGNELVAVEFDGEAHYRDPMRIRADREKDSIAIANGYKTVRIPYWLQLSNETLKFFFGLDLPIEQLYPHGFIDKKAALPASFCQLGYERFVRELERLPAAVRISVFHSLDQKISEYGKEYVISGRTPGFLV